MKKVLCAVLTMIMILGCACAEEAATAPWAHESGWISFSVAISQEGAEEVWDKAAEVFGASVGVPMTGEMLKAAVLQGHVLENEVEDLRVEGNRFTGSKADGTELFSHEYSLNEVMEEADIMDGAKVYVFRTEEADAGKYTWLLMTEPVKTEGENASYVSFNLVNTNEDNYRDIFNVDETGSAVAICAMIEKDTGMEGLAYAIQKMFANPVVISQ